MVGMESGGLYSGKRERKFAPGVAKILATLPCVYPLSLS